MIGVPGDRISAGRGEKKTGAPQGSPDSQPAASPDSGCLHLLPSSGTGSIQQSHSTNSRAPTCPPAPRPARGSPRQHLASSVIHSDAQLDFLFVFYIVATPLVTPGKPSKGMFRAWRNPCHPPPAHDLPRSGSSVPSHSPEHQQGCDDDETQGGQDNSNHGQGCGVVVRAGRVLHRQQEAVAALSMIAWLASGQEGNSSRSVVSKDRRSLCGKAKPLCSASTSTLPVPPHP